MIKKVVATILKRFDQAFKEASVRLAERDKNLQDFTDKVFGDMKEFIMEFPKADSRITIEEKNGGFMFFYKNNYLFRASVTKYSERAEAVINRNRVVVYNGQFDIDSDEAEAIKLNIQGHILTMFKATLKQELQKELSRL